MIFLPDSGVEETAIAAFWVTDGVDRCLVGFLPRHYIKHKKAYDGKLAQVVEILDDSESTTQRRRSNRNCGMCRLAIIQDVNEN